MSLKIVITNHAAKRFKQRKGMDKQTANKLVKDMLYDEIAKCVFAAARPAKITLHDDVYILTYYKTIDDDHVVMIRSTWDINDISKEQNTIKYQIKRTLISWLNAL